MQVVPPTSADGERTHTSGFRATLSLKDTRRTNGRRLAQSSCDVVPVSVSLFQDYASCEALASSVGALADALTKCLVCVLHHYHIQPVVYVQS